MPVFLLRFLSFLKGIKLKHILYAIGAAVLAYVIYVGAHFIDDKYEAEREVDRLELVIEDRDETIETLRRAAAQKDRALEAANAALAEQRVADADYNEIRRDAATAPEEDDGTVAPVLRGTLRALDGLR